MRKSVKRANLRVVLLATNLLDILHMQQVDMLVVHHSTKAQYVPMYYPLEPITYWSHDSPILLLQISTVLCLSKKIKC